MQDLSLDAGASTPACAHAVHFYDQAYPADAACDFIAAGVREGESCTVLLRAPHRHAVTQRLRALGLHPHVINDLVAQKLEFVATVLRARAV